jgi:hydrogenase expression/formation protein
MDLEGFVRRKILRGAEEERILKDLSHILREFKDWDQERREEFSRAVLEEVKTSQGAKKVSEPFLRTVVEVPEAGVRMGEFGVGSRGTGDFFVHRQLAEIVGETGALVDPLQQDDAGVVEVRGRYLAAAIDGMHSRLSDFPFLAGFHTARAALRDVFVMGSRPAALISDLHLGDDGDVGKLFDFTAGVGAVSEATGVPLVSGSTLRIGGDMVLGDRLVGGVGAVGTSSLSPRARREAKAGDVILLTEGRGGGTVTTIALYSGWYSVVLETLNVDFMRACDLLLEKDLLEKVHAMTDVTNGGLRGDAREIAETSGKKLVFYEGALEKSIHPRVLEMLRSLEIDPLGISTDALMLILPEGEAEEVERHLKRVGPVIEAGVVEEGEGAKVRDGVGREYDFPPLFREAPYTPVKKVIGEESPEDLEEMKTRIAEACAKAIKKKREIVQHIAGGVQWRKSGGPRS